MAIPDSDASSNDSLLARQAEEVRAYLVATRGGAHFLSSADSRLLLSWLDANVPVPTILSAIDRVALRRRQRRVRTRLTLTACKSEVKKALGTPKQAPPPAGVPAHQRGSAAGSRPDTAAPPRRDAFADYVRQVAQLDVDEAASPLRDTLVERLGLLLSGSQAPTELATAAIGACRSFHESLWDASADEREALLAVAAQELQGMKKAVSERVFNDLLEEVARDRLRRRYPLVSAQAVWDTLSPA